MHVNIYRCDRKRCREEKPAEYLPLEDGLSAPLPPPEWFKLDRRHLGIPAKHFCSLDCLSIWARQERRDLTGSRTDVLESK